MDDQTKENIIRAYATVLARIEEQIILSKNSIRYYGAFRARDEIRSSFMYLMGFNEDNWNEVLHMVNEITKSQGLEDKKD